MHEKGRGAISSKKFLDKITDIKVLESLSSFHFKNKRGAINITKYKVKDKEALEYKI